MKNTWMLLAIATFCVLAVAVITVGAQSVQPISETYSWSGELVAFDANSRTITVKSRVVGDQGLQDLPHFKAGERIVLTWSGYLRRRDSARSPIRRDPEMERAVHVPGRIRRL
jgi:hypothetical protein